MLLVCSCIVVTMLQPAERSETRWDITPGHRLVVHKTCLLVRTPHILLVPQPTASTPARFDMRREVRVLVEIVDLAMNAVLVCAIF